MSPKSHTYLSLPLPNNNLATTTTHIMINMITKEMIEVEEIDIMEDFMVVKEIDDHNISTMVISPIDNMIFLILEHS